MTRRFFLFTAFIPWLKPKVKPKPKSTLEIILKPRSHSCESARKQLQETLTAASKENPFVFAIYHDLQAVMVAQSECRGCAAELGRLHGFYKQNHDRLAMAIHENLIALQRLKAVKAEDVFRRPNT